MCRRGGERHNGRRSDGEQLCLNFVSEDLVNIYRFLCPSLRGIKKQEGLIRKGFHFFTGMKMFLSVDSFLLTAQGDYQTFCIFLYFFFLVLLLIWISRMIHKLTLPLISQPHSIPCLMSTQSEEARQAKPVTSPWFGGLKIITPFLFLQSSPLLLQPWYCNANTIALDWIRETTSCEMEPRLTTSPISHVNATTVHVPDIIEWIQHSKRFLCLQNYKRWHQLVRIFFFLFFLFTVVKLSERLGNNQRIESLTHVIEYYSTRGFLGALSSGFVLFPFSFPSWSRRCLLWSRHLTF